LAELLTLIENADSRELVCTNFAPPVPERLPMLHLTDKQQLILAAMQAEPSVTNERLAELMNVSTGTVYKQILALRSALKATTRQSIVPFAWEAGWRPVRALAEVVAEVLDERTPPSETRQADMQTEAVGIAANRLVAYMRLGNEKGADIPVIQRINALIKLNHELRREADILERILQDARQENSELMKERKTG